MNNKSFITHDLSVAAFLLMKGHIIVRADKSGNRGQFVFEFEDHDGGVRKDSLKFLTSEFSLYDNYLRSLRNMINSS
tara:strand:+ start:186 stop:416 length:231 start_codon:yes stop_codon:yes gene_type:complete